MKKNQHRRLVKVLLELAVEINILVMNTVKNVLC